MFADSIYLQNKEYDAIEKGDDDAMENDEYDAIKDGKYNAMEKYLDGMEETEDSKDYENLDGESRFFFLNKEGERSYYEELDEENEIMMSRSHNGDLNFDEENEDYDTMENAMEKY